MDEHEDHGHSIAAWVLVGTVLLACAIMSLAVAFPNLPLFIGGAAVGIVGLVAGRVLALKGYGRYGEAKSAGQ